MEISIFLIITPTLFLLKAFLSSAVGSRLLAAISLKTSSANLLSSLQSSRDQREILVQWKEIGISRTTGPIIDWFVLINGAFSILILKWAQYLTISEFVIFFLKIKWLKDVVCKSTAVWRELIWSMPSLFRDFPCCYGNQTAHLPTICLYSIILLRLVSLL